MAADPQRWVHVLSENFLYFPTALQYQVQSVDNTTSPHFGAITKPGYSPSLYPGDI